MIKKLWLHLRRRDVHPALQFFKYGIAGCFATVAHVSVFFFCSLWVFPALLADQGLDQWIVELFGVDMPVMEESLRKRNFLINNIIAFLFGNVVAYWINFHWVFQPGRHRRHVEVTLFLIVSAVAMFAGVQLGVLIIHFTGATTTLSQVGNILAAILINFVCRKYIVFKG
jgi:putative flippase GtrA